jgi:hypothetical protein
MTCDWRSFRQRSNQAGQSQQLRREIL